MMAFPGTPQHQLFPIRRPGDGPPGLRARHFRHTQDIPAKSRDIPAKSLVSLGFEGHTERFAPPPPAPSRVRPPPHRTQKFGLCSFFLSDLCASIFDSQFGHGPLFCVLFRFIVSEKVCLCESHSSGGHSAFIQKKDSCS